METHDPAWRPPHCPNPNCKYHHGLWPEWPYRKHGFYHRRTWPHRIQRFTCQACGRAFSSQTFGTTYWLKRLFFKTAGGMANCQISRDVNATSTAVDRQLSRLGRH